MKVTRKEGKAYDYLFKIKLIGDCGVGKSSLMRRFCDEMYLPNYKSTLGVDFKIKTVEVDEQVIKLQIWDTAGAEQFRALCPSYYRGSHGIVFVYDCTSMKSFKDVNDIWMQEVRNCPEADEANMILIGNKCDLISEKVVASSTAEEYAKSLGIPWIETSAKDSTNVNKAFLQLAEDILDRVGSKVLEPAQSIKISKMPEEQGYWGLLDWNQWTHC